MIFQVPFDAWYVESKDWPILARDKFEGDYADTTRAFPITLSLKDADGNPVSGTYSYSIADGESGTVTFEDGTGTISLSNGQSATVQALPYGAELTVTPSTATYYTQTVKIGEDEEHASVQRSIDSDNIVFHVKYVREEVSDSGLSDSTGKTIAWLLVAAGAVAIAGAGVYSFKKKES